MNSSLTFLIGFEKSKTYLTCTTKKNSNDSDAEVASLGSPMDFLNDPNSRQKLSKVRRELERLNLKIHRKKADQKSLTLFTISIGVLIAVLLLNISEFAAIFAISTTSLYLALALYLYKKVYHPLSRDLTHLSTKMNYLQKKMVEISTALSGVKKSHDHSHHSKRHSRKREVPDF